MVVVVIPLIIQDATEKLVSYDEEEVYSNPEVCSEIIELASTIEKVTQRMSKSVHGFIPYEQNGETEENTIKTVWPKAVTTSEVSFQTSNNIFSVDSKFNSQKVAFYPLVNVASYGKDNLGGFYVKAEHPGNCSFKVVAENENSITTENYNVNIVEN